MERRSFLGTTLVGLPAFALAERARAHRPLEILVLGGTGYLGPHIVRHALAREHAVTLFNRGRTNPHLFPEVEKLRGDRDPKLGPGLAALRGRRWDVVIDTWQGPPVLVRDSAALLAEQAEHYVYVSSIAVYGGENFRRIGTDETAALPIPPELPESPEAELEYPERKQLAEAVVRERFPGRHAIHRFSAIVGCLPSGAPSDITQAYWPVRLDRGGAVLAPGAPGDTNQWLDVGDAGKWIVESAEDRRLGIYNAFRTQRMDEFLYGLAAVSSRPSTLRWVDAGFLFRHGLQSVSDVPLWVSHDEPESGFYRISNGKALGAGLEWRPMADTFTAVREGFYAHHGLGELFGADGCCALGRREAELIAAWEGEH